ncbi:MAG: integration host factor subunit beta [Deltaproteobacteria bacterium]|nr:MAG: integration host factor subunit beta [Deltaproteobacteria bacterium]
MTKSQLIEAIARKAPHLSKKDVEAVVNLVFDSIRRAMRRGERVEIRGFGSFTVRERSARVGRNPKTGERVMVPSRRAPFFTVGKDLRERVNRGAPARMEGAAVASPDGYGATWETVETPAPAERSHREHREAVYAAIHAKEKA